MSLNITVNCDKVIVDTSFAPYPVAGAPAAASVAPQDPFDDVPPEHSVDGAIEPAMVDCVATALADRAEAANEYAQTAADHAQAAAAGARLSSEALTQPSKALVAIASPDAAEQSPSSHNGKFIERSECCNTGRRVYGSNHFQRRHQLRVWPACQRGSCRSTKTSFTRFK